VVLKLVNVVLVSGSTRSGSTNAAALRTAAELAPAGVRTVLCDVLTELPAFTPDADDDHPHPAVARLRQQLTAADAVLFCTPEYAGTLPGSLKNLIDWTVGTGELYTKPVAWLTVAAPGRGEGAVSTLRTVLGYVSAEVIEDACVRVPVGRETVGANGMVTDADARAGIAGAMATIAAHLRQP
jgi:NAD(P)H-dependent FMN reductase